MSHDKSRMGTDHLMIRPGKKLTLKNFPTKNKEDVLNRREAGYLLQLGRSRLVEIQDKLYAHDKYSVLIMLQAVDAAGKDGAIKHIMSGFNPMGVKVYSFKTPTPNELDHDYFWRHSIVLPPRGEIAIHNRSYYENVLFSRVHPENVLNEKLPGVSTTKKVTPHFWKSRYEQIKRYEKNLSENGMIILKFFLHLSKKTQAKRFMKRIDDPTKNWKFSQSDLKERAFWDQYQHAYEEAINNTTSSYAPWFVIPSDNKWYARYAIASIIDEHFAKLKLEYPSLNKAQQEELKKVRVVLENEQRALKNPKKSTTSSRQAARPASPVDKGKTLKKHSNKKKKGHKKR